MIRDTDAAPLAGLLTELAARRIRIRVEGDRLRCVAPRGALSSDLLANIQSRKREIIAHLTERERLPVAHRDAPIPLSFPQERVWLAEHLGPGSSAYHIPLAARLIGPLRPLTLARALSEVVRRHESLRTSYPVRQGRPRQAVAEFALPPLPLVDLSDLPSDARARTATELSATAAGRLFDLAVGPVIRSALVRLGPDEHCLLMTRHHIASDGWSFGVLAHELRLLGQAFHSGRPSPLTPLDRQYADFASWQRDAPGDDGLAEGRDVWRRRLAGSQLDLNLIAAGSTDEIGVEPARTFRDDLSPATAKGARAAAREAGTTAFAVLLASFGLALAAAAGQREVVVGSPTSGRSRSDLEPMIGCFATLLPLRLDLSREPTFRHAIRHVHGVVTEALTNQDLPLEQITEDLRTERRPFARTALIEVSFTLQNTPETPIELPNLRVEVLEPVPTAPKFPLAVTLTADSGGGYGVLVEYDGTRVDDATVADLMARFRHMLDLGCHDPRVAVADLVRWSPDAARVASDDQLASTGTLDAAFASVVKRTPDAIALSQGSTHISYAALYRRARSVAHRLREVGVGAEATVAVCIGHSADLVAAIVGTVLAGGVYVPVDPDDPPIRHEVTLADAKVTAVITERRLAEGFAWFDGPVLCVEQSQLTTGRDPGRDIPRHGTDVAVDNLAYVIYTSGSSGAPKGVMVSHRNVTSLFAATDKVLQLTRGDVWSLTHASAFDFSVWEMWGPLLTGARLVVIARDIVRDPRLLWRILGDEQVTVFSATPSAFLALAPHLTTGSPTTPAALRMVVLGGERCEPRRLTHWFDRLGEHRPELVNMYGITETTVHVTWRRLSGADSRSAGSPIGQALPGVRLRALGASGSTPAVGGEGELLVGGWGVARGYLDRPGLTADRFRPDGYGGPAGSRTYHSGDLGRVQRNGDFEYVGRNDQQLKVRGYRIEPAEIEVAIVAHPAVQAAAVTATAGRGADTDRTLVAYVVPAAPDTAAPSAREMRRYLAERLPAHLVPSAYVILDQLPLTRNGKLDRARLAAIHPPTALPAETDMPRTSTERDLARLWCDLLGIDAVGIHDDFFDIGGDSLLVTRLHARLSNAFGVELPLRRIYQARDIAAQAAVIDELRSAGGRPDGRPAQGRAP